MISEQVKDFLLHEGISNFIRYVKIWTTSDDTSTTSPSTENQFDLLKLLAKEAEKLGLQNIVQDKYGYI